MRNNLGKFLNQKGIRVSIDFEAISFGYIGIIWNDILPEYPNNFPEFFLSFKARNDISTCLVCLTYLKTRIKKKKINCNNKCQEKIEYHNKNGHFWTGIAFSISDYPVFYIQLKLSIIE